MGLHLRHLFYASTRSLMLIKETTYDWQSQNNNVEGSNQDTSEEVVLMNMSDISDSRVRGETFFDPTTFRLYQLIIPSVFTFIVSLSIIGNCIVIYVIASRKKLQNATNLLLMNLAVADVSFSVVCGGFSVVHYVLVEWPLGENVCRIIQYLLYVSCYVMVYTLMAVSGVRYMSVVYGIRASRYLTKHNICYLIIGIWLVFMVAKIPVLMVHSVSYDPITNRTECIIVGKQEAREFFASFFMFAYAVPLLVICTIYLKLVCYLKGEYGYRRRSRNVEDRARHVTKIVLLVVFVFAICWLPLHIHLLVAYYGVLPDTALYKMLLIVWHSLAYVNSLLNPIIYNYFSEDFRRGFLDVVCCCGLPSCFRRNSNPPSMVDAV